MSRHIIYYTDRVEEFNKVKILPGALKMEGRVPLTYNFGREPSALLGYAENMQQHDDGVVSAELVFNVVRPDIW